MNAFSDKLLAILFLALAPKMAAAQSYRGLSVLNDSAAWMSGSKGFVVRTNNGGKTWDTLNPKGYEGKDFRDIHAWSNSEALVMSAGDSAILLYTKNGGKKWKLVHSDNSIGVFWDAIDVRDQKIALVGDGNGLVSADIWLKYGTRKFVKPIRTYGPYYPIYTGGSSLWQGSYSFYAASGSNVQWLNDSTFICIPVTKPDTQFTFMRVSYNSHRTKKPNKRCFFYSENLSTLPFRIQKAGGPYSVCMRNMAKGVCVGGSYLKPVDGDSTACYTLDSGKTWRPAESMPGGYRSCVAFYKASPIGICTGTNGCDITTDGGIHWTPAAILGFNVCNFSENFIWLAGNKGTWQRVSRSEIFNGH